MAEQRVAIVAGARTPFVRGGKAFASLGPLAMARHAVYGLLERHHVDPTEVEALAFGVVVPEKGKPNLAREIVLETGLPARIEAQTVSSYCITGLRSATVIADAIARGRIGCGIAGGVEWLSGADPATFKEPTTGLTMGEHMEITRREWGISRERQDEIALASHRNAVAARERLACEIVPLEGVDRDTGPRRGYVPGEARRTSTGVRSGRNNHGRQCVAGDRWRLGRAADERSARESRGAGAARVHRRHGVRGDPSGRGASHGPGHRSASASEAYGRPARRHRFDRDSRGVRRSSPRQRGRVGEGLEGAGDGSGGLGPCERQRQLHRRRASMGRHRRTHFDDAGVRDGPPECAPGTGQYLRGRRNGGRVSPDAELTRPSGAVSRRAEPRCAGRPAATIWRGFRATLRPPLPCAVVRLPDPAEVHLRPLRQSRPLHQFHRNVGDAAFRPDIVDRDDVRMIQSRG